MIQIQLSRQTQPPTLKIEGDLDIYAASEAKALLGAPLLEHPTLQVDLSGVQELDTAGLQLLVWLKGEAARRGGSLHYIHHSPSVVEVLDLIHLTEALGDAILITPGGSN